MRVLAIDPGYGRCGIAVVERIRGQSKELVLFSDCIETSATQEHSERLNTIRSRIAAAIQEYAPDIFSIETLFFNSNRSTAIKVAEARGVALSCAAAVGLKIIELSPQQIKVAVTGNGKSDKAGIIKMIPRLVQITKEIKHDDEYDAIAIGIACLATHLSTLARS